MNPASVPFFPGGIRGGEDNGAFNHQRLNDQEPNYVSSLSISSEYRSIASSPSSLSGKRDYPLAQSPEPIDAPQKSTANKQPNDSRQYSVVGSQVQRDPSMLASLNAVPENEIAENIPSPSVSVTRVQTPGSIIQSLQHNYEKSATPPVAVSISGASSQLGGLNSSSPVSSLGSGSHFSPGYDNQTNVFDMQLRASPLIRDILDRLARCEISAREIQHDLGEVHHKVNLLLERALVANAQPEFKDPFAPGLSGNGFSPQFAPRPSISNIAPNQVPPVDDITTISQRLNTLTTSVGQLLALQTQQLQANTDLRNSFVMNAPQGDIAPNQILPSVMANHSSLGHGLPNRQDIGLSPRSPNPPLRTWSAGNLDLSMRQELVSRDKRRSTIALRRESLSVSY